MNRNDIDRRLDKNRAFTYDVDNLNIFLSQLKPLKNVTGSRTFWGI